MSHQNIDEYDSNEIVFTNNDEDMSENSNELLQFIEIKTDKPLENEHHRHQSPTASTKLHSFEFVEHPKDAFINGRLPASIQCVARNAERAYIECNSKIREDVKRTITVVNQHRFLYLL
jgi:hypothetical protein